MGKGAPLFLNGYFSCHIWAFIATTEAENWPREPFSVPLKGHSRAAARVAEPGGMGYLPPPPKKKNPTPKKCPFSKEKVAVLLKKNMHLFFV